MVTLREHPAWQCTSTEPSVRELQRPGRPSRSVSPSIACSSTSSYGSGSASHASWSAFAINLFASAK